MDEIKNQSSNIDLSYWLTSTINNITSTLIADLESKMIEDIHYFNEDRKIKHKNLPQTIDPTHLKYLSQNLCENFQNSLNTKINSLQNNRFKLTINMHKNKNKIKKAQHLLNPSQTHYIFNTSQRLPNSQPRSMLQISNHYDIFSELRNIQQDLIFLDLETDGLPPNCNILSICMTSINFTQNPSTTPNPNEEYFFLKPYINYKIDYKGKAYAINKITQKDIDNGILFENLGTYIADTLQNKTIVGYNINSFDIPILRKNLLKHKINLPLIKTLDLYQIYKKHNKSDLTSVLHNLNCYPIPQNDIHTASADTDACIRLLAALTKKYQLFKNNEKSHLDQYIQKI